MEVKAMFAMFVALHIWKVKLIPSFVANIMYIFYLINVTFFIQIMSCSLDDSYKVPASVKRPLAGLLTGAAVTYVYWEGLV